MENSQVQNISNAQDFIMRELFSQMERIDWEIVSAVLTLFACLALIAGLVLFLYRYFAKQLRVNQQQIHHLTIANRGNCKGFYLLKLVEVDPKIHMSFKMNGYPLIDYEDRTSVFMEKSEGMQVQKAEKTNETPSIENEPKGKGKKRKKAQEPSLIPILGGTPPKGAAAFQSVQDKTSGMADLLEAAESVVPGGSDALKEAASSARVAASKAASTANAPKLLAARLGNLGGAFGKLFGKIPDSMTDELKQSAEQMNEPNEPKEKKLETPSVIDPLPNTVGVKELQKGNRIAMTPAVPPGQDIVIEINLEMNRPQKEKSTYSYSFFIQQYVEKGLDVVTPVSLLTGIVTFPEIPIWRRAVPYLNSFAVGAFLLAVLVFLIGHLF